MGPSRPLARLHYLAAPLILFWWFYSLSVLDPTNVGWIKDNQDPFQAFLGWTAFRFSDWQWPLGMSRLVAYPNGMPLIATDSNPLVSIPLKLLSPLLPYPFQFEGWWLFISVLLSYGLAFRLLRDLSGRPLGSALGAALVAVAPIFPFRWLHNSLASQWLILAALSIFLRPRPDVGTVAKYAGLHALATALHPYYVPMIAPVAGMDLARRSICRLREGKGWLRSLAPLVLGLPAIAIAGLIAAWVTGLLVLTHLGADVGLFTMDPLAWFNPMGTSSFLPSWTTGWGQYEGYQYLGLGGFLLVLASAVGLALRRGQDARRLGHAALWLTPAFVVWYVMAVSPTVTAFGHVVLSLNEGGGPLEGNCGPATALASWIAAVSSGASPAPTGVKNGSRMNSPALFQQPPIDKAIASQIGGRASRIRTSSLHSRSRPTGTTRACSPAPPPSRREWLPRRSA